MTAIIGRYWILDGDTQSDGNMALMRAIDQFDPDHGVRFSTYACRAILNDMKKAWRSPVPESTFTRTEKYQYRTWVTRARYEEGQEYVNQLRLIIDENLANLSNIEMGVIKKRFNWEYKMNKPLTLEEIGDIVGLTKERIRQIQVNALDKIRNIMKVAKRKHNRRYYTNHAIRTT